MKKFDVHDILTTLTASDAKDIINRHCYVGGDLEELKDDVEHDTTEVLDAIEYGCSYPFRCSSGRYPYLLPIDKVKEVEEEKKWRAFTLEEFLNKFSIGTKISFRRKDETKSVYGLFEGYQTDVERIIKYQIIICNLWYTLKELFENYEYLDEHGDWQPFGVLDES